MSSVLADYRTTCGRKKTNNVVKMSVFLSFKKVVRSRVDMVYQLLIASYPFIDGVSGYRIEKPRKAVGFASFRLQLARPCNRRSGS